MAQSARRSSKAKTAPVAKKKAKVKRLGKRSAAESHETRRALLGAAAAAFAEKGLNGAKIDDIADRAGVTKGAIYSHFDGREDLLVQACRSALRELNLFRLAADAPDIETFINQTARALLAKNGKAIRMLIIEVHLSAARSDMMASLLAEWHAEGFATLQDRLPPKLGSPEAVFAMIHCIHLGLSHIDALDSVGADKKEILKITDALVKSFVGARTK